MFRICRTGAVQVQARARVFSTFPLEFGQTACTCSALAPPRADLGRPGPDVQTCLPYGDGSCATVFSTFPLDCSAPAPLRHRTRPNVGHGRYAGFGIRKTQVGQREIPLRPTSATSTLSTLPLHTIFASGAPCKTSHRTARACPPRQTPARPRFESLGIGSELGRHFGHSL